MAAQIIDGKAIAKEIRQQIKDQVTQLIAAGKNPPGLAVVIVGNNPASRVYVNSKKKACAEVGIYSEEYALPETASEQELITLVNQLNQNPKINGILVQLPLPDQIDERKVIESIAPKKDVDGFHPVSIGNLLIGTPTFVPCTPAGILVLLQKTGVDLKGKHAVVIGRSNIVGKPVAILLLAQHATVTICHSRTKDLPAVAREADILVVAIGKPNFINGAAIKPGAVVIDVGVNRVDDKLVGDVEFESASKVAGYITPVPGGVGPMTIAMLLQNTLQAAKNGC
ncbi:MAG: bifunctional methylenetetrahydrofolate dehydrogenase/methenyltetrahydrofolate cyclohydrolase FolD [bacterium]|nr:bifunctional methylenetetrahydrofolate dehydrogenase/methenyltetrahydrofolate cyclohydrolase FolD [bacterium]